MTFTPKQMLLVCKGDSEIEDVFTLILEKNRMLREQVQLQKLKKRMH